eukprot:5273952-Amphidinium_carterae.2
MAVRQAAAAVPEEEGEEQAPHPGAEGVVPPAEASEQRARPKTSLSSIKLDRFDGNRTNREAYRQWRKVILAHQHLYQLDTSELAMLIYLATAGEARETINVLTIDELRSDTGLQRLWDLLNAAYDAPEADRFETARAKYEQCRRRPGQSIDSYITELRRCRLEYLAEDVHTVISERSYSHKLLHSAGLRQRDAREVYYLSGEMASTHRVEEVLRMLFGNLADIEKRMGRVPPAAGRRPVQQQPQQQQQQQQRTSAYTAPPPSGSQYWRRPRQQNGQFRSGASQPRRAFVADAEEAPPEQEWEEDEDEEEAWLEDQEPMADGADEEEIDEGVADEYEYPPEEEGDEEVVAVSEAFAAGWTAKHRMAQQKQARGFKGSVGQASKGKGKGQASKGKGKAFRKGKGKGNATPTSNASNIAARKEKSVCAACGEVGHWKGDAVCRKSTTGEASAGGTRVHFVGMASRAGEQELPPDSDQELVAVLLPAEEDWVQVQAVSPDPDEEQIPVEVAQQAVEERRVRRRQREEERHNLDIVDHDQSTLETDIQRQQLEIDKERAELQKRLRDREEERKQMHARLAAIDEKERELQQHNLVALDRLIAKRQQLAGLKVQLPSSPTPITPQHLIQPKAAAASSPISIPDDEPARELHLPRCPRCLSFMVVKQHEDGSLPSWTCPGFPVCGGGRAISRSEWSDPANVAHHPEAGRSHGPSQPDNPWASVPKGSRLAQTITAEDAEVHTRDPLVRAALHARQVNEQGMCIPSELAPLAHEAQLTCPHPRAMLKWGGNVRAVWASCTRCNLQKVIYADRVGLHEELSGWTPAVGAAPATPAGRSAGVTPVAVIPKTPGIPLSALPKTPARRVPATPRERALAALGQSAGSGTQQIIPSTPAANPTTAPTTAPTQAPAQASAPAPGTPVVPKHAFVSEVEDDPLAAEKPAYACRTSAESMIADSGCLLTVAGMAWVQQLCSYLESMGIETRRFPQSEFFRFGAGEVQKSTEALLVPVKPPGLTEPSLICVSIVETGCPGLMSQRDLGRLHVTLDFGMGQLVIGSWCQKLADGKHPTVPLIADETASQELRHCWKDTEWLTHQAEQLGLPPLCDAVVISTHILDRCECQCAE